MKKKSGTTLPYSSVWQEAMRALKQAEYLRIYEELPIRTNWTGTMTQTGDCRYQYARIYDVQIFRKIAQRVRETLGGQNGRVWFALLPARSIWLSLVWVNNWIVKIGTRSSYYRNWACYMVVSSWWWLCQRWSLSSRFSSSNRVYLYNLIDNPRRPGKQAAMGDVAMRSAHLVSAMVTFQKRPESKNCQRKAPARI